MSQIPKSYENESYWNERLKKNFTLAGVGHIGASLALNRWAYRVRRAVLLRTIRDCGIELRGTSIFEVGFGTGFYLDIWREHGAKDVVGIDITNVAVQEALEKHGCLGWKFVKGDVAQSPVAADEIGRCDLAVCFDVLHHITDDDAHTKTISNMASRLKPGGHMILMDPVIFNSDYHPVHNPASWVRFRTLDCYRSAFESNGLTLEAVHPVFFLLNAPTDISGLSRRLFNLTWRLVTMPDRAARTFRINLSPGKLVGAVCYYPELLLSRIFLRGPSSHILVARKK